MTTKRLFVAEADAKSTVLVDTVAQLTQSHSPSVQQLQELLKVDDVNV